MTRSYPSMCEIHVPSIFIVCPCQIHVVSRHLRLFTIFKIFIRLATSCFILFPNFNVPKCKHLILYLIKSRVRCQDRSLTSHSFFFFSPFFGRLIIVYPFWNIQLFIFQKKKKKSNKRRRVRCQTSVSIKMQVRVKRMPICLPIMCSLFYYSNFLLFLLKIANYHPFDEDLDYPAKLERSAEGLSITVSDYCYFLFELIFFFLI